MVNHHQPPTDLVRGRFAAARVRFKGSWLEELTRQLKVVDVANWTIVFGAELLWSALPLIILLSSLADERVDDDLSRHIGLDRQGGQIVRGMFRNTPTHAVVPILTGLIVALAGTLAVVGSLQVLYERAFALDHRGWRDIPRFAVWLAVLLGALVAQAIVSKPVHATTGPVVESLVRLLMETIFFWWTMRFLLAGRMPWRSLIRPAFVTALLWLALSVSSSVYFSSTVVSDSRQYGTIGVVFTLLSWFVLIGVVLVLGAVLGVVWQNRTRRRRAQLATGAETRAGSG